MDYVTMDWFVDAVYYVVPFVVLLGVLVFVHELGHFLVARICGVTVTDFSIGFGKKLWGRKDRYGTEWRISAIPLGGYCKFLGDEDAASSGDNSKNLSEEEQKYAFGTQNPFKKLAIVVAGPGANYFFAILIFASIFFFLGKMDFPAVVGDVIKGSAADIGGIVKGDKILKVNGVSVKTFTELSQEVGMHTDGNIRIELERDGKILTKSFPLTTISLDIKTDQKISQKPILGVRSVNVVEVKYEDISLGQAFADASKEAWRITVVTLRGIGQMITGKRDTDELGGILRIAEMSGDITKENGVLDFIMFMALLSINLGLINLFPIPLLDGGHVVIYTLEIITRRELNEKVKDFVSRLGLYILVALMIFATYNDFSHLFNRWFS